MIVLVEPSSAEGIDPFVARYAQLLRLVDRGQNAGGGKVDGVEGVHKERI